VFAANDEPSHPTQLVLLASDDRRYASFWLTVRLISYFCPC
jgi:hypothetical protein